MRDRIDSPGSDSLWYHLLLVYYRRRLAISEWWWVKRHDPDAR